MSNMSKSPVFVLVGPTCSGKTTLKNMMTRAGFEPIKTWTTRKRRPDETDKDYEFVSKYVMDTCYRAEMFAEMNEYDHHLYASLKKDYISGTAPKVIVLDSKGARRILSRLEHIPFVFVYLNPHPDVLLNRAVRRDMDPKEFKSRIDGDASDLLDFYEDFFVDVISKKEEVPNCTSTFYAKKPSLRNKNLVGIVESTWHMLDQDFANWLWRFAMILSFEN